MTPEDGAGCLDVAHEGDEQTVSGGGGEGYLPIPTSASCPSPLHANEAVVDEDGWRERGEDTTGRVEVGSEGGGGYRGGYQDGERCPSLLCSFGF